MSVLLDPILRQSDISQVELHELRRRLNMVVQDASLTSGTLRDALDMTGMKDDHEVYGALRRVHLLPENSSKEELKDNPFANLETFVAIGWPTRVGTRLYMLIIVAEGANFSLGQRQLLCLARALLKQSKILVMDEGETRPLSYLPLS